jgi:hypothetical protein
VLIEVKARERVGVLLRQIVRRRSVERQVGRAERCGRQVSAQVAAAAVWTIKAGSASAEEAIVVEARRLKVQQGSLGVKELLLVIEIVCLKLS